MKKLFLLLLLMPVFALAQHNCDVLEIPLMMKRSFKTSITPAPDGFTKRVWLNLVTDYDTYLHCNKDTGKVRVFVNGWFEQWRLLYLRDSILIGIDSIGYWRVPEPYNYSSSSNVLIDFGADMQLKQPTADASHFVSVKNNGFGGVSYVGGLGQSKQYGVSFSHIYTSYYLIPTYSWTVEVLSHEEGHMFGSQHTHNCYWTHLNGWVGPIDSLYNCEGGCCVQTPTQSGTIMSYGHLTSFGIDFNKGFGPLPKAAIKQLIWDCYNNGLLKNPDGKLVPYVTNITPASTTANVSWSNLGTQYRYKIKKSGQIFNTYLTTNLTSVGLTNLVPNSVYWIRIKSRQGTWGEWSQSYKIKTTP